MKSKQVVFVYGTLKKGFPNHPLLESQGFFGAGEIKGTMISLGGFPGVVGVGNDTIKGEFYNVDEKTLGRLDRLEGHPRFYERKEVKTLDPIITECWTYLLPESYLQEGNYPRIPEGEWK